MISSINSAFSGVQDLAAMRKQMLQKLDQNSDGKVTKEEMKTAMPMNGRGPSVDDIVTKVDTNQDGSIDETENEAFLKQMPPGPPSGGPPGLGGPSVSKMAQSMFAKADTDGDGKITKDQFSSALSRGGSGPDNIDDIWKETDADGDGYVTLSEMEAAMKKHEEEMQASFSQSASGNTTDRSGDFLKALQRSTGYDKTGGSKTQLIQSLLSAVA